MSRKMEGNRNWHCLKCSPKLERKKAYGRNSLACLRSGLPQHWKDSLFFWQNSKTTNKNSKIYLLCWPTNYFHDECFMMFPWHWHSWRFLKNTNLPITLEVLTRKVGVCSSSSCGTLLLSSLAMDCDRLLQDLWL